MTETQVGDTVAGAVDDSLSLFEDILQAVCAAEGGCDCIITRNEKDYRISAGLKAGRPLLPVMSPSAFLSARYTSSVQ